MLYNLQMEEKITQIKSWLGTGSINIFGIAFSGKDTTGKRLATLLGAEFLSSGDIIRDARNNARSQAIESAINVSDTGVWMPTDEFRDLVLPCLYSEDITDKPLILSMIGRWIGEEQPVMDALKRGGHDTKAVILLNLTEAEAWRRRSLAMDPDSRNIGRVDDADEIKVQGRFNDFKEKTLPVIEVYRKMGILLEIDGEQDKDKVFADVIDSLYDFAVSTE